MRHRCALKMAVPDQIAIFNKDLEKSPRVTYEEWERVRWSEKRQKRGF